MLLTPGRSIKREKEMRLVYLATVVLMCGCNIRAVAILETEDAVYGSTTVQKTQKYDPKQRHLDTVESVMGAVNSDSLKSLGDILNGQVSSPSPVLP